MRNLIISNQDGVQYFTVASTGESGMSQSGLARACGVNESTIRYLIDSLRSKSPSSILDSFQGKGLEDLVLRSGVDFHNATILKDTFCAAALNHYAQGGKIQALQTLASYAAIGIRTHIQKITGWVDPNTALVVEGPRTYKQALLALLAAEEVKEALVSKVAELEPKAEMYDVVLASGKLLSFSDAAKIINSPGLGRNNLMQLLRDKGVLQYSNLPYQKYVNPKYFEVVEVDTHAGFKTTCKVTQKGLGFLIRLLKDNGYTVPSKAA